MKSEKMMKTNDRNGETNRNDIGEEATMLTSGELVSEYKD